METVTKEPIAIVGYGCVLPDAPDIPTFWNNLLEGKNSIREVPAERWPADLYWSEDKSVPDRTYAKIGAFVADDAFNGLDYRMPPNVVKQIDPCQRWALSATKQAFEDAGYGTGLKGNEGKDFDRDRCAVIIGNAMGGELQKHQHKRIVWAEARAALEADPEFSALPETTRTSILTRVEEQYKTGTNPITEDTMPGHLSNVIAGRIANAFNLGGKNFTTDAACASSLAALDASMDTLRDNEADMVVWGGTDRSMDVSAYVQFSKIGALSPDGSRPFDKGANGFVMGEGCAMFILKRLSDAERDGDIIHGVVRGIGGSSDGKGKGITAPNPAGQVKAVERAFADAECDLASIGYLEAHGTSTPVGDPVELQSVIDAAAGATKQPAKQSIYVGSVKSNLGHLKAGAGAVGVLKAILAVEKGIIPESINVHELNPRIDWENSPFRVATQRIDWQKPEDRPRRAAVSSFGFGGTNFHVVLEQHAPGQLVKAPTGQAQTVTAQQMPAPQTAPVTATPAPVTTETTMDLNAFREHMATAAGLEAQSLVLDADALPDSIAALPEITFPETGQKPRIRDVFRPLTDAGVRAERRVGLAVQDPSEIPKKLELAQKAATNPAVAKLAFQQGVFINQGAPKGKVAFLFPGQGTQYVNMGRDLARKYAIVRNTFQAADEILFDELGGIKLTDILWPSPDTPENQKASNEKLKLTEFTQPAVLAMDVAILRLMRQWGIKPDVVAGHSLGEYGALVAAGVLSFADALHAVAARGREMANVDLPDLGKMASIPADWETVSAALEKVDDYVICANKNCPSQTVIAGSSAGVEKAVELLQAQGLQCMFLPVSAAFHSEIVAPASKPLRNVLGRLDVQSPRVRVLSNVGAEPYPEDPEAIRDNLAVQVASPVEWIGIIERMASEGVTTFIEVGPKKALTGFCMDILKDTMGTQHVAVCSNHPKKGEIQHINELFAFLGAWGFTPQLPDLDDTAMYTAEFRDPTAAFRGTTPDVTATLTRIEARLDALERGAPTPATPATAPPPTPEVAAVEVAAPATPSTTAIGISGISVGLPGMDKPFFAEDNWDRILRGDNLIDVLSPEERQAMVDKTITRLVKSAGGQGSFETIDDPEQVIKLAGRRGTFDLNDWGVSAELTEVLDVTSQYAIAAALEALHDAGIPLQRTYKTTSTGSRLPQGWALPKEIGDETGVIFASAFPGIDALLENIKRDEVFNRKFLFHILSMGHAQVAQFLGARGPNTQINAACASTTQAITIAEDWIKAGRCKRVLVLGADDATSPNLMEWIGSGFLASGAATTEEDVTKAALPFDARRHGMIIGMGAVGLVVEAESETQARGMRPVARLLASEVCNSAFHGSRLDIEHIAQTMQKLVGKTGLTPADVAARTVFMSHETYTPARGGSAAAEIHALRAAFGADANKVVIANTKGFTGHPQGAGIEDAVVLKALQRGTVPPIPNLEQPDPELGDLNLSKGGHYDVRFALRLAAGFGSQVAMTFTELVSTEAERVADQARYDAWVAAVSGIDGATLEVVDRTLRVIDAGAPTTPTATPAVTPAATPVATPAPAPAPAQTPDAGDALEKVTALIAEKTGYPTDMLDPDMDMEADLGIDTVKQAELFGEMREIFGVPLDESLELKDYNTLRKVAAYMGGSAANGSETADATPAPAADVAPAEPVTDATPAQPTPTSADEGDALEQVTSLVAEKTGYPAEMLEPDLDMEADLGIDTVKQAELFGEMREIFGVPLDESLQLADYNTLRKVAAYMSAGTEGTTQPAAETPTQPAAPAQAGLETSTPATPEPSSSETATDATPGDTDAALAKVTSLVAEKTGYPAEMLEPDLDMEADLGIDTVKQAELFGELRDYFGVPLNEELQIADYNTLRKVAEYMATAATEAPTEPADADATAAVPENTAVQIIRRTPCLRPEASPDDAAALQRGPVLVVGDADTALLDSFKAAGFEPSFRAENPVGILYIATRPGEAADARARALFDAAKANPIGKGGFVAVVTRQDGAHGLHDVRDAPMAAVTGLGKALKKEFPEAVVKVIDLHPESKASVVDEVLRGGTRTEVCFDAAGRRFVVDVAPAALTESAPDVAGKHLIVSGGAQGITVEMLAALAPQGPKLLLLGRTTVPEEAAEWATWDDARWKQEEQATMAAMKEAGEKVTPVALQKAMAPKQKAAEVQRNLQRLTDLGAEVIYAPVDVTDADRLGEAVEHAREQFGPVAGIIHAAGVEISKDLASKDRAQFDLVFGIKHDGLQALLTAIPDQLEWLASFGSVAGRFGNIGQTDYSAVNEYLCKAVKQAAAERGIPTAFTIAWGPWGEVGMATKGSIMQIMEASGVTPIPTADGVAQFLAEMGTPGIRESVVAGTLGAIDADGQVVETAWDPEAARLDALLTETPERFRLLDGIEAIDDRSLTARLVMDQALDPYAKDHAIDGVPYLPGVFGLEAFAEAAGILTDGVCTKIEGARFSVPVKQLKDRPVTARIHVERVSAEEEPDAVFECHLTTRMVGPDGQERGEPRTHFQATLTFGDAEPLSVESVPPCTRELGKDEIYPPFFHGPSFQVLRYAGPLEEDESVGSGAMPYAAAFADGEVEYSIQPLIIEALFQLCGLRTMEVEGRMSLPAAIETLDVFHHDALSGEIRLWCQHTGTDDLRHFDAVACTPDGTVVLRMEGYGMVETGAAPAREAKAAPEIEPESDEPVTADPATDEPVTEPAAPKEVKPQVQTTLADAVPIPLAQIELPELDAVAFAAVNVDDADADPTWFTEDEMETHAAFKVEKRASEWRAGRLAAKAAIMEAAPDLKATDIVIENAEGGAPYILVKGQHLPAILSITHRDGLAVAAVAEGPIGLDLETTEERGSGFHEEAFNADEKALAEDPVGAACVWAAKEAVFKRIGTGLKQALHAWTVQPDDQGAATVTGPEGTFQVRFFDIEGRVLAVTSESFDPLQETTA